MIQGRRTGKGDDGAGFRFIQREPLCDRVARRESQKVRKRAVPTFLTFLITTHPWIYSMENLRLGIFQQFEFDFRKFFIGN